MYKDNRALKGFTLVELLMAVLILGFTLVGLLQVFIRCNALGDVARDKWGVMQLLQNKMEEIRERDYQDIVDLYDATTSGDPAETFDLTPLTGKAAVYVTQFVGGDDDLMQVKIVGSWNSHGRTYGEDADLDGVEDSGEDVDGDGDFSSMATIISFVANRS